MSHEVQKFILLLGTGSWKTANRVAVFTPFKIMARKSVQKTNTPELNNVLTSITSLSI